MRHLVALLTAAILIAPCSSAALQGGPNDLYVRVVDVGGGLCVVAKIPGAQHFMYDAGHWQNTHCAQAVRAVIGSDGDLDLLILSHSDADHIGNVPEILQERSVRQIVRAGEPRTQATWAKMNNAIAEAVKSGTTVINFITAPLPFGHKIQLDQATVTIIGGWTEWTEPGPTASERLNALSIVA